METEQAAAPASAIQQGDNIAHALAGAGGGLLSMTLTYPLITLSTRAQVESKRAHSSTYDAVRRIVQREGITGLYSGLDSALFGISVTNFVYYYCSFPPRPFLPLFSPLASVTTQPVINHCPTQGTNGPAPSSNAPQSAPRAPLRSSQPSNP
ncbi:MAG: hypothetical protein L6R39_006219 [Caloplaca ligustica]|nr:MAG: hypothetical protein L6R39_006219 [Caloplaca ligustica]